MSDKNAFQPNPDELLFLPLGGYVKITGMSPMEEIEPEEEAKPKKKVVEDTYNTKGTPIPG